MSRCESANADARRCGRRVTVGSLSYPLVRDDNGGGQVAGRHELAAPLRPSRSGCRPHADAFLSDEVREARPDTPGRAIRSARRRRGCRDIVGSLAASGRAGGQYMDAAGARRAAYRRSAAVGDRIPRDEGAQLRPGLYVAARGDQLRFSTDSRVRRSATWDANVSRVEVGVGYTIRRGPARQGVAVEQLA